MELAVPTARCLLTQHNKVIVPRHARSGHDRFVLTMSTRTRSGLRIVIFDFSDQKRTRKYGLLSLQLTRTARGVTLHLLPNSGLAPKRIAPSALDVEACRPGYNWSSV